MLTRRWWPAAVGVLIVVGALLLWWLWPSPAAPAPRARQYLPYSACLLTDATGISSPEAAPVWAGMQDASLATHIKVTYLSVVGPATEANAAPYLAGLVQKQCQVIVVVGAAQTAAAGASAANFPKIRFVVVGGSATAPNVTAVAASSAATTRADINTTLTKAAPTP